MTECQTAKLKLCSVIYAPGVVGRIVDGADVVCKTEISYTNQNMNDKLDPIAKNS